MGRWQAAVSSEVFHRLTKKRSALGVTTATIDGENQQQQRSWRDNCHHRSGTTKYIDEEERPNYYRHQAELNDLRSSSNSLTTTTETAMCNGSGGDVDAVVAAAPAEEEWSPIRETAPPQSHYQTFDHFPAEDPGASSDMDTEEDVFPLVRRPRKVSVTVPAAAAADDARADAVDSNVGLSGAVSSAAVALDRSEGGVFVTATTGEPAPKRKRLADLGRDATVEVSYEGLTRESKMFLQQALQTWASWHSSSYPSGAEATEEVLQSGTELYSPALVLEPTSITGPVSVWVDKPLKNRKAKVQDIQDGGTMENQDKEKDVPLYDRVCISAVPSQDVKNPDGHISIEPEEVSRCFNCGAYSHPLRNCPRPLVMAAIKQARDTLNSKRGPRQRPVSRYYQCTPGGKFDDLKPGVLSLEARKAIGIGEQDPPPWLNRMREIGYPPGYLEDTEEESSGVKIIDDDDAEKLAGKESVEGNVEHLTPVEERKIGQKMAVEYPGINAPIPENSDNKLWASSPEPQPAESPRGSKRPYHQISQMHNGGSGLLSPNSPANLWAVGARDVYQSFVRNVSSGHSTSNCRSRFDGMESYIDVHGSNLYGTSPLVNVNGNLSVAPAHHWSKRRVNGTSSLDVERTNFYNGRSDAQAYRYIHSIPSGLASPIRDMFGIPSPLEHISLSPSHVYSPYNYHHGGPQGSVSPMGPTPNESASQTLLKAHESASQAWLKAQSALDALRPTQSVGDFVASPHLQHSRGPGMPHQWGRR